MDMMESGQAPQLPLAGGQNRSGRVERLAAGDGDARHVADQRCQLHRTVVVAMATMVATMPS
jgi:hypothetical protein